MGYNDMETDSEDKFIQIKAGESVQLNLISKEPTKQVNHWVNKKKISCSGKACEFCENGDQPRVGWKVQVIERKTGKTMDWEFGKQIASQVKELASILAESGQTIHEVDIRIKRVGSGQFDTEYFVNQVPKKNVPLTEPSDIGDAQEPF